MARLDPATHPGWGAKLPNIHMRPSATWAQEENLYSLPLAKAQNESTPCKGILYQSGLIIPVVSFRPVGPGYIFCQVNKTVNWANPLLTFFSKNQNYRLVFRFRMFPSFNIPLSALQTSRWRPASAHGDLFAQTCHTARERRIRVKGRPLHILLILDASY